MKDFRELSLSDLDTLNKEVVFIMAGQNQLKNRNQPYDELLRNRADKLSCEIQIEMKKRVEVYISHTRTQG